MGFWGKFLFVSLFLIHPPTVSSSQQELEFIECLLSRGNFTNNSAYQASLNHIFSSLTSDSQNDYGFYNVSFGQNSDKVNTIALCRGDVKPGDCISCINYAAAEFRRICPNQKAAILCALLICLRLSAAVYLLLVLWQIEVRCNGGLGGRAVGPNCNLRLETYSFYDPTPDELSILPPPLPQPEPPVSFADCMDFAGKEENSSRVIIIIVTSAVAFLILNICSCICIFSRMKESKKRRKLKQEIKDVHKDNSVEALQFDFDTIRMETENFSSMNKLGHGGFGAVYKGKLLNGKDIAVKRLLESSAQEELEFKNEARLMARLQHRNLVRPLGFCLEGNERLLIYEFVPSSSLNHFIFGMVATPIQLKNTGNFTVNGMYGRNRDLALSSLASNTSENGGFYNTTVGKDPNKKTGKLLQTVIIVVVVGSTTGFMAILAITCSLLRKRWKSKQEVKGVDESISAESMRFDFGFCLEGNERLLIYEFVPNSSLDHFILRAFSLRFTLRINSLLEIISHQKVYLSNGEEGENLPTNAWKHWMELRDCSEFYRSDLEGWLEEGNVEMHAARLTISLQALEFKECLLDRGNFTNNSAYQASLNHIFSSFTSDLQNDYGFYNVSFGQNSDKVNAIALCRGDVMPGDCISCINDAATELRRICPNQKAAILWKGYKAKNITAFNDTLNNLLDTLIKRAALGDSHRKFATGTAAVPDSETIHALVQCTPDLSQQQCTSCLSYGKIEVFCNGGLGGKAFGPKCNLRFETYSFYDPTPDELSILPPPLPRPAPPQSPLPSDDTRKVVSGKEGNSSRIIIIIVTSAVAFLILNICSCICFLYRMKKSEKRRNLKQEIEDLDMDNSVEALQFDFDTIRMATDNFSSMSKLGQGGFGAVYKGTLLSRKDIAVKRLLESSAQGELEFKNEVRLMARLQHRNLVRRCWVFAWKEMKGF
ncbi:hypothetical protein SLEP1_g29570 [Rubroshorea leprosula]|uniref:Uncharacterized protein n=1 Tax=Rubroshorea leprosula TaxID=152421 RepID=A0AAV5JX94_9ROSI|nr:hypothetical protein SLEP1_g29570 [Rubroshorea leprosula]